MSLFRARNARTRSARVQDSLARDALAPSNRLTSFKLAAAALVLLSGGAAAQDLWDARFHANGVDGTAYCAVTDGADIYVGGYFLTAGNVVAEHIARWDGSEWHALGPGLDDTVYDLVIWNGDLIACGTFLHAGDLTVNKVARWDGSEWHALGGGISDPYEFPQALAVYQGELWCSGYRWNGQYWSQRIQASGIRDLIAYDGLLVAGGDFLYVNGQSMPYVAAWNGTQVIPLPGQEYKVVDLEVFEDQLYALREWTDWQDPPPVSMWNGSGWSDVGDIDEVYDVDYRALLAHDGALHLLGLEDDPYWWRAKIATWNGVFWNWTFGAQAFTGVSPQTFLSYGQDLILAGRFGICGSTAASGVARIADDGVYPLGPVGLGVGGNDEQPIWGLEATPEGVAVCGTFDAAGPLVSGTIALWDGTEWQSRHLGHAMCSLVTWHQGQLHAFPRMQINYPQHSIWNGTGWDIYDCGEVVWATTAAVDYYGALLTTGTDIYDWSIPDQPALFAQYDADGLGWSITLWNGQLVVGGDFTSVDGVPAPGIAIHDGSAWSCPGGGVDGWVYALAVFDGRLIAGGTFSAAGGAPAARIAAWDGQSWQQLGAGFDLTVRDLAVYDGSLYAGGQFTSSGINEVQHLARFDGAFWQPVGGGTDRRVSDLAVFGDKLYLSGEFRTVGDGIVANRMAVWDGSQISAVAPPAPPASPMLLRASSPFRECSRIGFVLRREENVRLTVIEPSGRRVATLIDGRRSAGPTAASWNGRDEAGRRAPAGTYLLRLKAGGRTETVKVVRVE